MDKVNKKQVDISTASLALEMLKDCEVMARYAMTNGLKNVVHLPKS